MSHYYTRSGEAAHFQPKKDGSGNRPTTVADCRKLDLLPSVTTVLKILDKPALTEWRIRQGIYSVVTSPDVSGEGIDAKITRILGAGEHEEESKLARDKGESVHAAIETALNTGIIAPEWAIYVSPVLDAIFKLGRVVATERIVIGEHCAGKTDCITDNDEAIHYIDFKTCRTLPQREPWGEHKMQVAFYASTATGNKRVRCAVIYISTTEPGKIAVFEWDSWPEDFKRFQLLVQYHKLTNGL